MSGEIVELFNQRASAVDRGFDREANRDVVEEICRRLDGVPLAIELAAARIRTLSPVDLEERLDDSFRLLTGGRRRSVERHRTLRATIQWSYDLLSPQEQMLFPRLSIFAGSFDLRAAETVTPDEDLAVADVNDLLGDLVERSMVLVESGPYGRRFRLLEIMRQYGAEHLAEQGNSDLIARRHADHVAADVAHIAELLTGRGEIEGAGRLTELWPNLRAAVDWASANDDLDLAVALVGPIAAQTFVRRGVGELVDWAERVLAMADPDDDETIALGLLWTALHHVMTHDRAAYARIEERYGRPDHILARAAHLAVADDNEETLTVAPVATAELRRRGDEHIASLFEVFVGGALLGVGRLDEAEAHLEELAARFRTTGPPSFLNWTLFMLAAVADFRGDHERAEVLYDESLAVPVPPLTNSPNEILEARAAFRRGDHDKAFAVLRSYIDELLEAGNMSGTGLLSLEFVNMMTASGRLTQAARVLGYLDNTGMLDGEGPGFRLLVADASQQVDSDPDAAATRREVTADVDDEWALRAIREMLDDLLNPDSTAAPPRDDQHGAP